jgi:hypothetical protein
VLPLGEPSSVPAPDARSEPEGQVVGERRRFPRHAVAGMTARVSLVIRAELLDLSRRGALCRCECAFSVGDHGELHVLLDREPFNAWVSVVRVLRDPSAARTHARLIAVVFTALDEAGKRALAHFLNR